MALTRLGQEQARSGTLVRFLNPSHTSPHLHSVCHCDGLPMPLKYEELGQADLVLTMKTAPRSYECNVGLAPE